MNSGGNFLPSSPACDPHKALERGSLYLIKS